MTGSSLPQSDLRLPIPGLAKAGALVMALGLLLDVVQHTLVDHHHEVVVGAFPVGEHLAHLVVLIGMVLVLVGIVADGVRTQRRQRRHERSVRRALR